MGTDNLFVPYNDRLFVAPSLSAHYIGNHEYQPPVEFQEAVMLTSRIGKLEYYQKIKRSLKDLDNMQSPP
jgi:hypothetical protein